MEQREGKLKASLPDGVREGRVIASSVQDDGHPLDGKKSFMSDWRRVSDICEVFAVVAISLGVNLLTSRLDGIAWNGSFSLERFLGLLGSSLVTFGGTRFLYCRWRIAAKFDAFSRDLFKAEQDIDKSPKLKGQIHRNFIIGVLAFFVGLLIYLARGISG